MPGRWQAGSRTAHIVPLLYCCTPTTMPVRAHPASQRVLQDPQPLRGIMSPCAGRFPAVQSVQKAAAGLAPYTDGASADEVAAFLTHLCGIGAGLHEMMQTENNVGQIFREYAFSSSLVAPSRLSRQADSHLWWCCQPEASRTADTSSSTQSSSSRGRSRMSASAWHMVLCAGRRKEKSQRSGHCQLAWDPSSQRITKQRPLQEAAPSDEQDVSWPLLARQGKGSRLAIVGLPCACSHGQQTPRQGASRQPAADSILFPAACG